MVENIQFGSQSQHEGQWVAEKQAEMNFTCEEDNAAEIVETHGND